MACSDENAAEYSSNISRPVVRTLSKVKTSMQWECDLNLRSSCMRLCIRGEYVCRYVSRIHAHGGTYVSDSSRQLDGIDAVAHPSAAGCYAYKRVHPHIKGGVGCSFVPPSPSPRYTGAVYRNNCCVFVTDPNSILSVTLIVAIGIFFFGRIEKGKSFAKSSLVAVTLRLCARKSGLNSF